MATWLTVYGIDGTPMAGRINLDRVNAIYVGAYGGYKLWAQCDDSGYPLNVSNVAAPFPTAAAAITAAATLFDTNAWVQAYGSSGNQFPGWINPAAIASIEVGALPANGGYYLQARCDSHGGLLDVSDRTSPFATQAAALTAADALIAGLP